MRKHKHNFEGNLVPIGMYERINMFWHLTGYCLTMRRGTKGTVAAREVGYLLFSSSCLVSRDANKPAAEVSPQLQFAGRAGGRAGVCLTHILIHQGKFW